MRSSQPVTVNYKYLAHTHGLRCSLVCAASWAWVYPTKVSRFNDSAMLQETFVGFRRVDPSRGLRGGAFMTSIDCDCELCRTARCASCGAEIIWAKTLSRASMPLDVGHSEPGRWRVEGIVCLPVDAWGHVAHWANCPDAARHRRRGAQAPRQHEGTERSSTGVSEEPERPRGAQLEMEEVFR